MKTIRTILIVIGLLALVAAPILIIDSYKARRCMREASRLNAVRLVVRDKVEAYYKSHGQYPDSITILSFTKSPQEMEILPDLRKIRYRRTETGYSVGWVGDYGAWSL